MAAEDESFLVFAAIRNEGPFLVEWVSWYRMLGFRILIAHNDCTDHSADLLDALARAGWISTFSHVPGTQRPKASAYLALRDHPAVAAADWMLICDVDEFLILHEGPMRIEHYLDLVGRAHQGVCFHWRCFGTNGRMTWEDSLAHRRNRRAGPRHHRLNISVKTMMKSPLSFRRWGDHAPHGFRGWGRGQAHFIDGEGRVIERFRSGSPPFRFTGPGEISHRMAQMNHYALRDAESFALKAGTPSASAGVNRYTPDYYRRHDLNGIADPSAMAYRDSFDPVFAAAMALPEVARAHHLCCADRVARIAARAGRRAEDDSRWQHHMTQALAQD